MPPVDESPLYRPSNPRQSSTWKLLERVNREQGLTLSSYEDFYAWSTAENSLDKFWSLVWDETDILGDKGSHVVDASQAPSRNPPWFTGARINWAENMLRCRSTTKCAMIEATEPVAGMSEPPHRQITYSELYELVSASISSLLQLGLREGDRVASYSSNCIENVVACLAATAIGCIWVSAAADFGPTGVLERLEQVQPKIIFAVDAVAYNAKVHPHIPKLTTVLENLVTRVPEPPRVVVIQKGLIASSPDTFEDKGWMTWKQFLDIGAGSNLGKTPSGDIEWQRRGFDWPLWILFSSGTTGRPKPIVHRAGGMLLQLRKELAICADMSPEDVFFYYTTTGWMMWNFLVSGLSTECTLVLYDGSPLRDPAYLWRLVDELGITVFGTSAKYLDQLAKGYKPREHHSLKTLKHIYSTGSPLAPPQFDYVYEDIKKDVLLASITGGTDICSLFAGMNTALPVFRGEIQCRELGMAIAAFDPTGATADTDDAGELVCARPFPCEPLGFWPLPGFGLGDAVEAAHARFQDAYFKPEVPGVWYHGDHVMITKSRQGNGGGVIMLGRSDGVLNPGGVRFGSAEIYDVVDACFGPAPGRKPAHTIADCLAVGQKIEGGADERVVLFVKLMDGEHGLSDELQKEIRAEVRKRRSARHVPARIVQVADIPYTLNGKRVEVPVKKIINGAPVASVNPATLRNPDCLEEFAAIGEALRTEMR